MKKLCKTIQIIIMLCSVEEWRGRVSLNEIQEAYYYY